MIHPARWFAATSVVLFIFAFVTRVWAPRSMDLQVHDTYFVLSPAVVSLGMAFSLALFATTYYVLSANPRAASGHFWVTAFGLAAFWISFYLWGHVLMRHATAQADPRLELGLGIAFVVSGLILLGSLAMFAVNVLVALWARLR